jgi:hypothetical protein
MILIFDHFFQDIYYKKLCALFPNPSENIAYLLQKIKQSKSVNSSMIFSRDDLDEDNDEDANNDNDTPDKKYLHDPAAAEFSEESINQREDLSLKDDLTEGKIAELMSKFDEKLRIMEKEDDEYMTLTNLPINIELRIDEPTYRSVTAKKPSPTELYTESRRLNLIQAGGNEPPGKKISPSSSSFDRSFRLSNESRSLLVNAKIAEEEADDLTEMSNEDANCVVAVKQQHVLSQSTFMSDLRKRQMELQNNSHPISSTIRIQVNFTLKLLAAYLG